MEPLPMHSDFARWYNAVDLGDNESRRQERWAGVSVVAQAADSPDIEVLIRLAFRSRQPGAAVLVHKFRQAFKTVDATFDMEGNDRELQVLAAASLVALIDEGTACGAEAALAVTTAALDGARKPDLPMDLQRLAESAIEQAAITNCKRPDLAAHISREAMNLDFGKSIANVRGTNSWEGVAQSFTMAAEAVDETLTQLACQQASSMNAIDKFLQMQDEELQMLWWLTGNRSFDLDCAFDKVPADCQALVFGKELADSTRFLPGPASAKALLSRAGLKSRKAIALSAAITGADPVWLRTFMSEATPSPVSTPIHFAIMRQLETGPGDAWIAGWAAAACVAEDFSASPLTLGLLFYRERLILRFSGKGTS